MTIFKAIKIFQKAHLKLVIHFFFFFMLKAYVTSLFRKSTWHHCSLIQEVHVTSLFPCSWRHCLGRRSWTRHVPRRCLLCRTESSSFVYSRLGNTNYWTTSDLLEIILIIIVIFFLCIWRKSVWFIGFFNKWDNHITNCKANVEYAPPTPPIYISEFYWPPGTLVKTGVKPYPLSPNHPVQHYHTLFNLATIIE